MDEHTPEAGTASTPSPRPRFERWLRWGQRAFLLYGALTVVGVAAFVLHPTPDPWTPAVADAQPPPRDASGRTNWAALAAGARVRANEWDYFHSHHPLFLIDGEPEPSLSEKWASLPKDPYPWLEIALDGPHDIDEVVVRHAGWRESAAYTNDRYAVRCYRGDALVAEAGVIDNQEAVARHPLECPQTDRIRLDFDCTGRVDVARIYEVEAWGH
jgi:hypothetical protein